jgi:hypothetical protein
VRRRRRTTTTTTTAIKTTPATAPPTTAPTGADELLALGALVVAELASTVVDDDVTVVVDCSLPLLSVNVIVSNKPPSFCKSESLKQGDSRVAEIVLVVELTSMVTVTVSGRPAAAKKSVANVLFCASVSAAPAGTVPSGVVMLHKPLLVAAAKVVLVDVLTPVKSLLADVPPTEDATEL